jgi:hypothetical protein
MFGPRAAHAVAATLVQAVNTPTDAVPTVHAPAASEFYVHSCSTQSATQSIILSCTFPALPASKTLIAESFSYLNETSGAELMETYIYQSQTGSTVPLLYIPFVLQDNGCQPYQYCNPQTNFVGAIRYASLDVRQLVGVAQISANQVASLTETVVVSPGVANESRAPAPALPPPPPPVRPQKITVSATVQAAFQIQ